MRVGELQMFCFGLFFSLQPLSAMLGISIVRQRRFLKPILLFLDLLEQVAETQLWERPSLVLPRVCFTLVYLFCIWMCIPWGQKRTYKLLFSLSAMWSLMNNLKLPSLVAKCLYLLKHLIGLCFGLVFETGSLCSPDWPPAQKDLSASATKLVLGSKACATTTVVLRQLSVALNSLCSWRCLWTPDPSLCSASDWTRGFVSTRQALSIELHPQPSQCLQMEGNLFVSKFD